MPKDAILNSIQFFVMEIPNIRRTSTNLDFQDIDFQDFIKIYKKCTAEPYSFLVNDTTLLSDNPLRFRKNLLK